MDSDQIDGGNLSHGKKKGVRVSGKHVTSSEWDRRSTDLPIVQTNLSAPSPTDNSTTISIGPHCWSTVSTESQPDDYTYADEWNREGHPDNLPPEGGVSIVSEQAMKELKSLLKERSKQNTRERNEDQLIGHHCHIPGQRIDCKPDDIPSKSFTTFRPTLGSSRSTRDSASSGWESGGSLKTDGHTNRPTSFKLPTSERKYWVNTGISQTGQCPFLSPVPPLL